MATQVIYDRLSEWSDTYETPPWYDQAILRLRAGGHRSYGLYLYNQIRYTPAIKTVVDIGTARGFSAVCAARAIADREKDGTVHTIDVRPSDEPYDWHAEKHPPEDPVRGKELTVRELVEPFALEDGSLPIQYHCGDSISILSEWSHGPIDLVFHDGRHTYEHVRREIELIGSQTDEPPIHVFDDCFIFENEWTWWLMTDSGWLERLNSLPYLRRLPEYGVVRKRSAGVARAVEDAFEEGEWNRLEIIRDDWAPITALVPDSLDIAE